MSKSINAFIVLFTFLLLVEMVTTVKNPTGKEKLHETYQQIKFQVQHIEKQDINDYQHMVSDIKHVLESELPDGEIVFIGASAPT